jgi:hypothetical protein
MRAHLSAALDGFGIERRYRRQRVGQHGLREQPELGWTDLRRGE